MVAPTNVRLAETVEVSLRTFAQRTAQTKSSVINTALAEWLAVQAHPRIHFLPVITGERRACLIDGPEVWTIADSWLAHSKAERDPAIVADAIGLTTAQVETALDYWADYRDEIDGLIERHHLAQDEALASWERRQSLTDA
ncbi:hypothetical protein SAMN06298212_105102 [Ruaniaceae bacterium KH17]|nr:hypothetical protein SAMN06298212_105102 [Ruaniaceae bacterium KH17]